MCFLPSCIITSLSLILWCLAKKVYLSSTIFKRVVLFFCVLVVEMLRSFKGFTCDVFCTLWTSWISLLYVMSCFFECHECLKDVFWTSLRHLWDSWNEHIKKSMKINSLMKWPFAFRNRTECYIYKISNLLIICFSINFWNFTRTIYCLHFKTTGATEKKKQTEKIKINLRVIVRLTSNFVIG